MFFIKGYFFQDRKKGESDRKVGGIGSLMFFI